MRFAAEPLVLTNRAFGISLGLAACLLQIVGVVLFLMNRVLTRHRNGLNTEWQSWFVSGSLAWFLLISLAEPLIFLGSHQASNLASTQFIAEWFPPMRDAQFLGFVSMMIFGVSLTKLNTCFGIGKADRTNGLMGLAWWTLGLILRITGHVWAYRHGFEGASNWLHFVGGLCLTIGAVYVVVASKVFGDVQKHLRSHKFIRAAYTWLLVAGLLIVIEPIHLRLTGQQFSHAYSGAIRHALTVGFISQMIIGVGSHVISTINDLNETKLPSLIATFWLLNVGNLGRVAFEIGTDYNRAFFAPMGVTGFLELTGLILWATPMLRNMFPKLLLVRDG